MIRRPNTHVADSRYTLEKLAGLACKRSGLQAIRPDPRERAMFTLGSLSQSGKTT